MIDLKKVSKIKIKPGFLLFLKIYLATYLFGFLPLLVSLNPKAKQSEILAAPKIADFFPFLFFFTTLDFASLSRLVSIYPALLLYVCFPFV